MKQPTKNEAAGLRQNNPFFIAIDGLKILFSRAPQIALTMAVLSGLALIVNDRTTIDVPNNLETNQDVTRYIDQQWTQFVDKIQSIQSQDWIIIGIIVTIFLIATFVASTLVSGVNSYTAARMMKGETVKLSEALDV